MITPRTARTVALVSLFMVSASGLVAGSGQIEFGLELELFKDQIIAGEPLLFAVKLENKGVEVLVGQIPFEPISTAMTIYYNRGAESPRKIWWPPKTSGVGAEKYISFEHGQTKTLKGLVYFNYDPDSRGYPFSQPDFYTLKAVVEIIYRHQGRVQTKTVESNFATLLVKPTPPTEREILELIDPESFDYHLRQGSIGQKASKVEIREDEPFGAFLQRRAQYPTFEEIDNTFQRNRLTPYIKFGLMKAYSKAGKPRKSIAAASRLIVYAADFPLMEEVYRYLLKAYRQTEQQPSANTYERFLREQYPDYYEVLLERGEL